MSLAEQARSTRLAWEAGDREAGVDAAVGLIAYVTHALNTASNGACDGDEAAEHMLERITPQLCALAERMAAVSR